MKEDIVKQQERLAGIIEAINRDQLIAEKKAKDIKKLLLEEEAIKFRIHAIQKAEKDAQVVLDAFKEANGAIRVDLGSRKAKLQEEIEALTNSLKKTVEWIREIELNNAKSIANTEQQVLDLWRKVEKELETHNKKKEAVIEETRLLEADKVRITREKQTLDNELTVKKEEAKAINQILCDIIQRQLQLDDLDAEIASKT